MQGRELRRTTREAAHLELLDDGRRVIRDEELLQVVDDHLVHAIGAQRGAHTHAELLRRLDVLERGLLESGETLGTLLEHALQAIASTLRTSGGLPGSEGCWQHTSQPSEANPTPARRARARDGQGRTVNDLAIGSRDNHDHNHCLGTCLWY